MAINQKFDGCQLEIDNQRGVIYVHGQNGQTLLRICRLPKPVPEISGDRSLLDITHMYGCNWDLKKYD